MKDKTSVASSLSNKDTLTDAQVNAGFGFNTILESPDLNGQLYDIDSQVNIITKEICNFLTDNGVTLNSSDNTQLKTLMTALLAAKQNTLTAGNNITIDENGVISAAQGELPNIPIFFNSWFDFKPVNIGWVNASSYSWLYSSTYQAAYQLLVDQYAPTGTFVAGSTYYNCKFSDGQTVTTTVLSSSGTLQQLKDWCDANSYSYNDAATISELEAYKTVSASSETIGSTTITYYNTYNDMKIVIGDAQIANAESIYNTTGVAWYYILDTVNERFKLPRTKYGFTGIRDTVGKYVPETLPNIKGAPHTKQNDNDGFPTGAFYRLESNAYSGFTTSAGHFVGFDASLSSSAYQDDAPVQQRATQMYLYFYIGNFTQTAIENTAGLNASLFNNKLDMDAQNLNVTGKSYVGSMAMPSNSYIDLTLGTSESTYTAPANGYLVLEKLTASNGDKIVWIQNSSNGYAQTTHTAGTGNTLAVTIPMLKGQTAIVRYTADGATQIYRFIYAEGSV